MPQADPPTSTAGIGWGADVGISARTRLAAEFTRVSSIQATDIAVDPSDPSNIWIVGPVNATAVNPACGQPYGGPLLKWDWASSAFKPVPGMSAAGMRVTIMPGIHKPWIVDGCGQLCGWSAQGKNLFGPAPQGRRYDVAAANGTVFSGCSFYNPSPPYEGNIAAGCHLSATVGPNGALYTSDAGDVAGTAEGVELLIQGQDVLYRSPTLSQYFRAYRAPDGMLWVLMASAARWCAPTSTPIGPSVARAPCASAAPLALCEGIIVEIRCAVGHLMVLLHAGKQLLESQKSMQPRLSTTAGGT
ncbi:inositol monophosphatase [Chlorella sorokiniana]|uniref:Inositol monophosphatase n=1 Tax=Chlorella sorokiniana TaxID=3076 RepID=A0A2P6TUP9_CHLSO|nr:inositol monophosphatase [Chlorella sorokiniana]|eukprot:PRW57766.1 inositol monophosphatase [Chlorella sorokiniana]